MKIKLSDPIEIAYKNVDEDIIMIKIAFLTLCANIERHIRLETGVNIHKKLTPEDGLKLKALFPLLSNMSLDQLERLILIFQAIRNINAHLYIRRRPIFIDNDLVKYFKLIFKPKQDILKTSKKTNKNTLTIFGAFYILTFLSQKYMMFTFLALFYKSKYFMDINPKDIANQQSSIQHEFQKYCGIGKIIQNTEHINNNECRSKAQIRYLNNLNWTNLIKLFFDFEKVIVADSKKDLTDLPFSQILRISNDIPDKLIRIIIQLRNALFHGYELYDDINVDNKKTIYDLSYLLDSLLEIKKTCNVKKFDIIKKDIENYSVSIFNFYALRIVEISYKILDKRLFNNEKMSNRINQSINALNQIFSVNKTIFEKCEKLLPSATIKWKIHALKFTDKIQRQTETDCLKIYKFHSKNGFDINGIHCNETDMAIACVNLQNINHNKINGKYLSEYKLCNEIKKGKFISIFDVED